MNQWLKSTSLMQVSGNGRQYDSNFVCLYGTAEPLQRLRDCSCHYGAHIPAYIAGIGISIIQEEELTYISGIKIVF